MKYYLFLLMYMCYKLYVQTSVNHIAFIANIIFIILLIPFNFTIKNIVNTIPFNFIDLSYYFIYNKIHPILKS